MDTLIIFGAFILAAFVSGFMLGHYKREGKLPEQPPQPVRSIKEIINAVKVRQERPPRLTKSEEYELGRANEFFN